MGLEDYKDFVATCAAITTLGQMLAGTVICRDIYRKRTSHGVDPMPFMGGIGMCILVCQYAWILQDSAMINVNICGILANIAYMAVYYYFTPQTQETHALIGKTAAFVAALIAYAQLEDPEKIEFRFGGIVTVLSLLLLASPLVHLGDVIKTKSTDILPFPLILMATLVTFWWLLYGLIINNGFVIFQNAVGFTLSLVQLSLFFIFPSKASDSKAVKKED